MKYVPIHSQRILAIDPTTEGLAYAVLEDQPLQLIDWGIKNCGRKKAAALRSAAAMIERYRPDVLVMEDCGADGSRRHHRVQNIIQNIIELASQKRVQAHTFSREDICRAFAGTKTKAEIAAAVTGIFPELAPRLPRRREIYFGEDYRMAIFDVVALGVTWIYFEMKFY
jgi:hypothetical protein